jgi:hypothetical protein
MQLKTAPNNEPHEQDPLRRPARQRGLRDRAPLALVSAARRIPISPNPLVGEWLGWMELLDKIQPRNLKGNDKYRFLCEGNKLK